MTKFFVAFLLFFVCASVEAQDKTKTISNAEAFSEKAGILVKKEFEPIGTAGACEVEVLVFTDMVSGISVKSLKIEVGESKATLDADEVDGLIKSIKIMRDKVFPLSPEKYTEVVYRSRGGFEIGAFLSSGAWKIFMRTDKYDSKSFRILKDEDLVTLLKILELAKTKL